jgi:hypothetical protein
VTHFDRLLEHLEISPAHLSPRNATEVRCRLASQTVEAMNGLATAYGVKHQDVIRACLVLGFEHMLGAAEELGHYAPPQDST